MRFEAGNKIGAWTLVSDVDAGLVAPLWVANDGKHVAYVRNYRVRSPKTRQRLEQVAGWAKSFDHQGILPVRERHEIPDGVAVMSHYEEGQPLASLMTRARLARKPMPAAVAASLIVDMIDGLDAMGGKLAPVWTHGGVRPEAVLVTRAGRARLMEVGLSGVVATSEPLSLEAKWAAYAAPEQLTPGRVGGPTDVFTVAAILWEMLVGRPLFAGKDAASLRQQILQGAIERADTATKDSVPKALSLVVEQALDRDADDRYESAHAFGVAIRSAMSEFAEPYEVSRYLEQVQLVALDTRRRVLTDALGRPAPTSMPPPPKQKAPEVPRLAAPPKVPTFDRPAPSIPSLRARPDASKSPASPAEAKPAPRRAAHPSHTPLPPARSDAPPPALEAELVALEAGFEEPVISSRSEGLSADAPADAPAAPPPLPPEPEEEPEEEPLPLSHPAPPVGEARLAEEPPSVDELPAAEEPSAEPSPATASEEPPVSEELPPSKEPPESEEVAFSEEPPVSEEAAPSDEPPVSDESPRAKEAPGPTAAAVPAPADSWPVKAAARAAAKSLPPESRATASSIYDMRPRRRWPWFVLGILMGAGGMLAVVYQAPHLLPYPVPPRSAAPTATTSAPRLEDPPAEPEPTEVAPAPSTSASDSPAVPRIPRRGVRRVPAPSPGEPVPPPPTPPPPAGAPTPPSAPKPAEKEPYE